MKKKFIIIGIGVLLILIISIILILKFKSKEYYTVTFLDTSQNYKSIVEVEKGKNVNSITISKTGYEFLGWYLNGIKYNFNEPITSNLTLEAKWKKNEITNDIITEKDKIDDLNKDLEDENKSSDSNLSKNDNNDKNNNTNNNTNNNKNNTNQNNTVNNNNNTNNNNNNSNNSSSSTSKKYTVYFNSDGGSAVSNQTVNENGVASRPANPIKDGYVFENWYLGNSVYNFNTKVNQNITLVAHWTVAKIPVNLVTLSMTNYSMNINDSVFLTVYISPDNATNKSASWNSSNTNVATVSNGTVKAVGVGSSVITVTVDGKPASCNITVVKPITYSYEIKDASGSTTGQVYIYIKSSEGGYVNGTLTITYTNGGSETVNIPSSGYLFPNKSVIASISNVKGS